MTRKEALQALAAGKRVTHNAFGGNYLTMEDNGLIFHDGGRFSAHLAQTDGYELYQEPNPHTKGTFAWAREEARRGRTVRSYFLGDSTTYDPAYMHSRDAAFYAGEIDSTDWEVVDE